MPIITPGVGTRERAITDLIESVALQQTALSHIMNAEGEKMQVIINAAGVTVDELMDLNRSVELVVNAITRLEMMLHAKLELFSEDLLEPVVGP